MSERLGKLAFWLIVAGFNVGFFPMHALGLLGMPRRVYTYGPAMGWGPLNLLVTFGAGIAVLGGIVFVVNALWSLWFGSPSGRDPWGGSTLEWACPSPPPAYNFADTPAVESLVPMWEAERTAYKGIAVDRRELLVTSVIEAEPIYRQNSVGPSIWPLIAALGVTVLFIGSIFTPWALVWGAVPVATALTLWFWPQRKRARTGPLRARS